MRVQGTVRRRGN